MSLTTFNKQSNQLFVNNNLVQNSCTEIYGNNDQFIVKDCNNDPVDQEFIHALFAQLTSSRKMLNRLKEDFGLTDDLDNLDYKDIIKFGPLKIGFDDIKSKTIKRRKSKKNNSKKSKKK